MLPDIHEVMPELEKETILNGVKPFDPLTRLEYFCNKFPLAMQILKIGGVHPNENTHTTNPYTGKSNDESFTNVGEHCLAVAILANTLALEYQKRKILSPEEVELITSRALVHDAGKRFEIMRREAIKEGIIYDAYSPKAYETIRPLLQAQGINSELINYMAEAGKETGHLSLSMFLLLSDGNPSLIHGELSQKIIHLADDMTSTNFPLPNEKPLTVYVTPWERMIVSEFSTKYPWMWKEGLAFDNNGNLVTVKDIATDKSDLRYLRSYAYWQPFVANEICREIQATIDPTNKQKPEYFIKDLINSKLIV